MRWSGRHAAFLSGKTVAAVQKPDTFKRFFDFEKSGGILLIVFISIPLDIAHSRAGDGYLHFFLVIDLEPVRELSSVPSGPNTIDSDPNTRNLGAARV